MTNSEAKRDKLGRVVKGGVLNPSGNNGSERMLLKIKSVRRKAAEYIDDKNGFAKLVDNAENGNGKVSAMALQCIVDLFMPRLKPVPVMSPNDLDEAAKEKLQKLIGLPPEEQTQKVIELYITGTIDCSIASTLNELIKSSQNALDESKILEQVKLEIKKQEESKND